MAVAHSQFVRCVMQARSGASYQELGGADFDERRKEALTQRLVRRLETLGFAVSLKEVAA